MRPVVGHRLEVLAGVASLDLGVGRVGNEGVGARIFGLGGEVRELLVGDAQLVAQRAQPCADLPQPSLDLSPSHPPSV